MQKKLLLFLFLMGSFVIPLYVRADMGLPEIRSYDVVISNVNGAKAIGEDKVIPYETKCTVFYESEYDGFLHLDVDCENDNYSYTVNAEDVRILKNEYIPMESEKLKQPKEYYIFKDIDMYKGPSYKYELVNQKIPANSIVKINYSDTDDVVWGYVEYEGKKGWIYIYWNDQSNKIANVIQEEKAKNVLIVKKVTKLYKYPTDEKQTIDIDIPEGTLLKSEYHYPILKEEGRFFVNYNGVSGWLDAYDGIAINSEDTILILKPDKVKVYDANFKRIALDIKKYQELVFDYKHESYVDGDMYGIYRVKYKGKVYYLNLQIKDSNGDSSKDYAVSGLETYWNKIEVSKNAPVYENFDEKKIVGTVDVGEKFNKSYAIYVSSNTGEDENLYFFIKTSTFSGWIDSVNVEIIYDEENDENSDEQTTQGAVDITKKQGEKDSKGTNAFGTKEIVTMCILGAVISSLVAFVIIIMINRKNKKIFNDDKIITINDKDDAIKETNFEFEKETNSQE